MTKYGVHCFVILLALSQTYGRPTSDVNPEEIKKWREEVMELRKERPCYARLLEVRTDIREYKNIHSDPHYVPECDEDGKKWRARQCDHHDAGACFCVHEDNGEILEHTRDLKLNKEALMCANRTENGDHSDHECFLMRDEFNHMQREYGLTGHSPLPYYPECTKDGKFMALQRNDMSQFFCVDTEYGDIIPETTTDAGAMPPLTEDVCQAYDEVWKDFKKWNSSIELQGTEDVIDESSCSEGFIYTQCGCPRTCTSETTVESESKGCNCKPACVCPEGKYEFKGKCISLEECHESYPVSNVLHSEKLKKLTRGGFSRWKQYREQNPNALLAAYNTLGQPEEEVYAGGPIAYDENPNGRRFFNEGPPEEENIMTENQNDDDEKEGEQRPPKRGQVGAERVPIEGERLPFPLQVIGGSYQPEVVEDIMESGTRTAEASTYEPERSRQENGYGRENDDSADEKESYHGYYPEEEEEWMNENGNETEEYDEEHPTEASYPEYIYEYYGSDNQSNYEDTRENSTFETDIFFPWKEENDSSEEDYEEYESKTVDFENEYNEPETAKPAPSETSEAMEEDISQDELSDHQKVLTTVPAPHNDEALAHSSVPPCEEENTRPVSDESDETSEKSIDEEALEIVNRVLSENKVIGVTLEKQTQSVKKSNSG